MKIGFRLLLVISCFIHQALADSQVKNIILLIGDGMGPQQVGLLVNYARYAPHSIYPNRKTAMEDLMAAGTNLLSLTNPANAIVVDSACSATQLATGVTCSSEMIGLDKEGNSVETILERAEKLGKSTGLVSDTRITHATPAPFASHQAHRNSENEIAEDLLAHEVDVLLSGGLRHFLPNTDPQSKRKDDKNLLEQAKSQGYEVALDRTQLTNTVSNKVLGLFGHSGMVDALEESQTEPTLKEMTVKALEILSKNDKGFFLMIEGGQIDWAAHNNDAGTLLHEMIKFDEAIKAVHEWVKERQDTVVILTADHETGGFGFSYSRNDLPTPVALAGELFKHFQYQPEFNFGSFAGLDKIYNQKKSFEDLFAEFDKLPSDQQSPLTLMQLVNTASDFKITVAEAADILVTEPNQYYVAGHTYLSDKNYPKVKDFKEFYVYGKDTRNALLARLLAKQQNIVWATGTHTATPVTVTIVKPAEVETTLSGMIHHTDIGKWMLALFPPS